MIVCELNHRAAEVGGFFVGAGRVAGGSGVVDVAGPAAA